MMKRWDIAIAGEVYVDHIFTDFDHVPLPGEEVFAEQYRREAGGGTVNTACALARLGHRTSLFGVFGEDEEAWLRARLSFFGVYAEDAHSSALPNALTVSMSTRADRSFLSYAGANRALEKYVALPETIKALSGSNHIHFAMPLELELAKLLLPDLKSAGCTLSIDPGWRKEWFLKPSSLDVLRMVDLFFPNEGEAQLLTGQQEPEQMLRAFAALGLEHTVIKLGARGAVTLRHHRFYQMAPPEVQVVDTTGAGDAFDAGFIDAWLSGADIEEQLRRACICGSLSTRARGALSALPSRQEILGVVQENSTV
ncbi:carbohydrate kinase family protein [Granulicella sp. S190]|uniref:carbohydrate kinase family protein n=1 Tax=Granulicella sp. S190 TaxID=1747226 RepID=UPI00131E7398|nr:carbohydrate kinase family protein [Granulicella sp. S190]